MLIPITIPMSQFPKFQRQENLFVTTSYRIHYLISGQHEEAKLRLN